LLRVGGKVVVGGGSNSGEEKAGDTAVSQGRIGRQTIEVEMRIGSRRVLRRNSTNAIFMNGSGNDITNHRVTLVWVELNTGLKPDREKRPTG